jgi:hypothetical protein
MCNELPALFNIFVTMMIYFIIVFATVLTILTHAETNKNRFAIAVIRLFYLEIVVAVIYIVWLFVTILRLD